MRFFSISGDALFMLVASAVLVSSPSWVGATEISQTGREFDSFAQATDADVVHREVPQASAVGPVPSSPAPLPISSSSVLASPETSALSLVTLTAKLPAPQQFAPDQAAEWSSHFSLSEARRFSATTEAVERLPGAPAHAVQAGDLDIFSENLDIPSDLDIRDPAIAAPSQAQQRQATTPAQVAQALPSLPPGTPPLPAPLPTEEDSFPDPLPEQTLPEQPLPELPPASDILPTPLPTQPGDESIDGPSTINVTGYSVEGSTVFSAEELAEVTDTEEFTGEVSFSQLLQARSAVTQLYVDNGYVTSGAFIPPQTLEGGLVKIQVLEGKLEDIRITGNEKLRSGYIRSRLARAGAEPLNVQKLLEGLKLLQIDPLLGSISADLQAGIEPGTSLLDVTVTEADPFTATVSLDNARSPSVGSFRRKVSFNHANLIGFGDALSLAYSNTDGSNALDLGYTVPLNARNGTLRFAYGRTRSEVIEDPFSPLEIAAKSIYYEGTYRQPLYQTASEEFALGLTFSRQESSTKLGFSNIGGFPLSPGADEDGRTKISALRFFQEWNKRSSQQVLAARSQLSLGTDWFDANQSDDGAPDSSFFSWRGQGQWVRLLAPDTLALVRGDLQFADRTLVPLEQFGIGGQSSVRGYRQDSLLTDNGLLLSAEVRLPVARIPNWDATLQVAPFFDLGHGWNKDGDNQPEEKTLMGTGLGFIWRQGNNFSARLDWGFPLVDVENEDDTWQENGIYFSVDYNPF